MNVRLGDVMAVEIASVFPGTRHADMASSEIVLIGVPGANAYNSLASEAASMATANASGSSGVTTTVRSGQRRTTARSRSVA